jgi:pyridoxine 5-phosphate synthase|uniref:Pyridoxine 5'-phosphate synthase n=1 Tax=candidate division WOR-3 bacterium TaxID=2052148 RepID=A0A7C3UQJ5_UNCW3
MKILSVNLDHIATLREARKEPFPDPVQAALLCELGGADGITVHLRTDRRHIKERDLRLLRETIKTELNLEMATTEEMLKIALKVKPDVVTLVPERPEELTTEGGLDLIKNFSLVKKRISQLKDKGILTSIFIEPSRNQIEKAKEAGADKIELNTDTYARESWRRKGLPHLTRIKEMASYAQKLGLLVHAGHGLNYWNIIPLAKIPEIEGFSIGFAIVARAVFVGLKEAVSEMKRLVCVTES